MPSHKVKILYSHGGRILHLHPNRLSYVGGHTKLLSLDRRSATLPLLLSRLPSPSLSPSSLSIKYQLPGLDLDSLVSLVDNHDFLHMLYEYDSACSASASTNKSPRLRLFLFPVSPTESTPSAYINPDYLFGLDDLSSAGRSDPFEDLVGGENSNLLAEPDPAIVPEPIPVTVPVQMSAGYHPVMQPMTGPIGNAYYALPVGYYDGGRFRPVQPNSTMAGDGGYRYNSPHVIGYDGSGVQKLFYVLPHQGYPVGVEATGGVLGQGANGGCGVGLAALRQASAV